MSATVMTLIPARGGSKGIPRKNLRTVGGISLVARSIRCALASSTQEVWVSTDDSEIAHVANAEGATKVIARPASLSSDEASTLSVIEHALRVADSCGALPNITVLLQCTAPLTVPNDIDEVITTVEQPDIDSAMAVCSFHGFLWKQGGRPHAHDPMRRLPRQKSESVFLECGSVYGMKTDVFLNERTCFCGRLAFVTVPRDRFLQIDDDCDLQLAERIVTSA